MSPFVAISIAQEIIKDTMSLKTDSFSGDFSFC
jgi:hypothetical protein